MRCKAPGSPVESSVTAKATSSVSPVVNFPLVIRPPRAVSAGAAEDDLVGLDREALGSQARNALGAARHVVDPFAGVAFEVVMVRKIGRLEPGRRPGEFDFGDRPLLDRPVDNAIDGRGPDAGLAEPIADLIDRDRPPEVSDQAEDCFAMGLGLWHARMIIDSHSRNQGPSIHF